MDAAPESFSDAKNADHFAIDDLLDFPNDEDDVLDGGVEEEAATGTCTESSTVTAVDTSCNSSFSAAEAHFGPRGGGGGGGGQFSGELCLPYEELAELEWLSNFVEESFSSEDLQKLELIQGVKARKGEARSQPESARSGPMFRPEMPVPGKARSKRSRAAPGNWTSRLHMLSLPPSAAAAPAMSSSSESDVTTTKTAVKLKKREGPDHGRSHVQVTSSGSASGPDSGEGRKCLHCATDKTPQWRTGPMGPKTLCNACGVRYKSGRLVPEYRPAASPTFVLTKHSNSHRKVLELRRQKGLQRAPPTPPPPPFLHQNVMFEVSNGDDYLIHQHIGPDFRQLI